MTYRQTCRNCGSVFDYPGVRQVRLCHDCGSDDTTTVEVTAHNDPLAVITSTKPVERIERVKGWKKPERLRSGDEPRTVVRHDPQERIRQLEEELAEANADRERLALYEDYLVKIGKLGFNLTSLEKLAESWFEGRIERRRASATIIPQTNWDPDEWYMGLDPDDNAAISTALDLEINRLAREDKSPLEDPSYGFDALMKKWKGATTNVRTELTQGVARGAISQAFADKVRAYVDKEEEYRKAGRDLTMVSKVPSKRYAQLLNNERNRMTGRLGGSLAEDICLTIPQEDGQPSYPNHMDDMPGYYMRAHSQVRNFTRFGLKPKEEKHLHRLLDAEEGALKARAADARALGPATVVMHTGAGRMVGTLDTSVGVDPADTVVRGLSIYGSETSAEKQRQRMVDIYKATWNDWRI